MKTLVVSAAVLDDGRVRNIGDEALTQGTAAALARAGLEVVASLNGGTPLPPIGGGPSRRDIAGARSLAAAIRSVDAVVIGGGTLLADNQPGRRVPGGLVRYVFAVSALCRVLRRPYAFVGVGSESWPSGLKGGLLRAAVRGAAFVGVRDESSAQLVEARAGVRATVTGDTFFGNSPDDDALRTREPVMTVAMAARTSRATAEQVVAIAHDRGLAIAVRRMDQAGADEASAALVVDEAQRRGVACEVRPYTNDWREVADEFGRSSLVVASRLHALILASSVATPSIAAGELPKVRSYCRDAGVPHLDTVDSRGGRPASREYVDGQRGLLSDGVRGALAALS